MNVFLQVIILGIVQGLSEWLPISSSAHLLLVPWLMGWRDLGLIFDVALHLGTLTAILLYFRRDWVGVLMEFPAVFRGELDWGRSKIVLLFLGTIPAALLGLLGKEFVEALRTPRVIAFCLIGFGILLWATEHFCRKRRSVNDATAVDAFWIGTFQMLALIPGVSRSGITITGGLFRRFRTWDAARISFLLCAPAIAGAGLLEGREALREYLKGPLSTDPLMQQAHPLGLLILGIAVSALSGFACIRYFLRYLGTGSLTPFVIYRIVIGLGILALLAFGYIGNGLTP